MDYEQERQKQTVRNRQVDVEKNDKDKKSNERM